MRLLHLIKMFIFFYNYYGGSQIAKNMKYVPTILRESKVSFCDKDECAV